MSHPARKTLRRAAWLLSLALAVGIAPALVAEDVVHLVTGESLRGKVEALESDGIQLRVTLAVKEGEAASSLRKVPDEVIGYIDFEPLPDEPTALEWPDRLELHALAKLWSERYHTLKRPRSPAGEIGLALARRWREIGGADNLMRAFGHFRKLEVEAWSNPVRLEARRERLATMLEMGRIEEAMEEIISLAAESDDPTLLIEAGYLIAEEKFAALRRLEEEHPRWWEDELVLPEHERLYHEGADQYLFPYLFHGSESELAARGLLRVAELHLFVGRLDEALACVQDVLIHYPESEAAIRAPALRQEIEDTVAARKASQKP